MNHLLLFLDMI